jgi:LuxR family maltose regulon positive regulatory protein
MARARSHWRKKDIDTLVSWMHHLPASTDPSRIDLQINLAWALAHYFRFDESRQLLDNLDQMVVNHRDDIAPTPGSNYVSCAQFAKLCQKIPESLAIVEPLLAKVPCGDMGRWSHLQYSELLPRG